MKKEFYLYGDIKKVETPTLRKVLGGYRLTLIRAYRISIKEEYEEIVLRIEAELGSRRELFLKEEEVIGFLSSEEQFWNESQVIIT